MADEPVGEVEAVVVYELAQFVDTQGREVMRLTPLVDLELPVRYRGKGIFMAGKVQVPFMFEIEALSVTEAFEKYDARRDEEGDKIGVEMRKSQLTAGTPQIDRFRLQRQRRFGGNGG